MDPSGNKAYRIVVTGSVQGVGFRAFTVSLARKLGIAGAVRNCPDSSVEIFAEGEAERLDRFIESLKEGNGWSRTDHVAVTESRIRGLKSFEVDF